MQNAHPWSHAAATPDKPALIIADDATMLTYGAMMDGADRAGQLFTRLGLVEGDTVALMLENHVRYTELCWAAKDAGLYYVCISSQASVDDAIYILENCGARVFIASLHLGPDAVRIAAGLQRLQRMPALLMLDGALAPFASCEAAIAAEKPERLAGRHRGNSMLYSSGTTGRPKGVRAPISDALPVDPPARYAMLLDQYRLSPDTVFLALGPLYHVGPQRLTISTQRAGGTVISMRRFDAEATLAAIETYRVTHAFFVPTMFIRLLKLAPEVRQRYDLSSLRFAVHGAAPCPISVKQAMIDWWGPVLSEIYGATEGIGQTLINSHEWLLHKGSVGKPPRGCEVHVLDDQGRECGPNETGLVYLWNGRPFEYFNDPEKTSGAFNERGWATLGDIGHLDEDGYLYLTDRASNTINSGGVNIYPQESENLLVEHPAVLDVAVFGVPHEEFGESAKAIVVPATWPVADAAALEQELIAFCIARLGKVKSPRSIEFEASLPRSEAGKLLKKDLKARYWLGRSVIGGAITD